MTEILNDLDLGWCSLEPAAKIWLWFAVGSRFVVPFIMSVRNQVSGVAEFPLSEMITARLKTTPQDLLNLHHSLHNMERLRHDGRYVRIRLADDR